MNSKNVPHHSPDDMTHPELSKLISLLPFTSDIAKLIELKGGYILPLDDSLRVHIFSPATVSNVTLCAALLPLPDQNQGTIYRKLLAACYFSIYFPCIYSIESETNRMVMFSSMSLSTLNADTFESWLTQFSEQAKNVRHDLEFLHTGQRSHNNLAQINVDSHFSVPISTGKYKTYFQQVLATFGENEAQHYVLPECEITLDFGLSTPVYLKLSESDEKMLVYARLGEVNNTQTLEQLLFTNARESNAHFCFSLEVASGQIVVTRTLFIQEFSPELAAKQIIQFAEMVEPWRQKFAESEEDIQASLLP
jgi:hypothetical protein